MDKQATENAIAMAQFPEQIIEWVWEPEFASALTNLQLLKKRNESNTVKAKEEIKPSDFAMKALKAKRHSIKVT